MVPPDSDSLSRVESYSGIPLAPSPVSVKGLSPAAAGHSKPFTYATGYYCGPTTPEGEAFEFGLVRVRSPLLTESLLFSLPPGT